MKRAFKLILTMAVLCFGVVQGRAAEVHPAYVEDFYVTGFLDGEGLTEWSVHWTISGDGYYLMLPSAADLKNVQVHYSGQFDEAYPQYGGQKFSDGDVLDLTGEEKLVLGTEPSYGKPMEIEVIKSETVASMHFSLDMPDGEELFSVREWLDLSKSNKTSGTLLLVEPDGTVDYNGKLKQIKGRGNATWDYIKKPYNIKLDKGADLLGMGKNKNWCLLANFLDRSLLRNKIVADLAEEVGIPFTMKGEHIDLYIDGEYRGTYLLTEKVEIGKDRVDIRDLEKATEEVNDADLDTYTMMGESKSVIETKKWLEIPNDPEDITGGYLLEMELNDRYPDEASGFVTSRGQSVVLKSPEYATKAQIDYISDWYQEMEDAVYSKTGYNEKGKHYSDYLDEESVARMYLLQEYSLNVDSAITSFYFYKESDLLGDGKMYAAPPWDFDIALGNYGEREGINLQNPEVWWANRAQIYNVGGLNILAQAVSWASINKKVVELWNEEYMPAIKVLLGESTEYKARKVKTLDQYVGEIQATADMNFHCWSGLFAYQSPNGAFTGNNYKENIAFLRNFLTTRRDFMDAALNYEAAGYEQITGSLTIEGAMQVGETLTARLEGCNVSSENLIYRWMADGEAIAGAEDTSYTLTEEDEGKYISVAISCQGVKQIGRLTVWAEEAVKKNEEEPEPPVDPGEPDSGKPDPGKPDPEPNIPVNPEKPDTGAVKLAASNVTKLVSGKNGVKIQFEKSEHAASYEIYRNVGSVSVKLGTTSGTSYVDKNPVGGKKMTYTVKALSGDKARYADADAGQGKEITLPKAPTKLKAKQVKGRRSVFLSWKKVKGASAYLIYRSEKKTAGYKLIKKVKKQNNVHFTDRKKVKKKTYYYRVTVLKKNCYSPFGKAVKATVK